MDDDDIAYIVGYEDGQDSVAYDLDQLRAQLAVKDAEIARLREALRIIAGYQQCIDNIMGNQDIARAALKDKADG